MLKTYKSWGNTRKPQLRGILQTTWPVLLKTVPVEKPRRPRNHGDWRGTKRNAQWGTPTTSWTHEGHYGVSPGMRMESADLSVTSDRCISSEDGVRALRALGERDRASVHKRLLFPIGWGPLTTGESGRGDAALFPWMLYKSEIISVKSF